MKILIGALEIGFTLEFNHGEVIRINTRMMIRKLLECLYEKLLNCPH